MRRDLDEQPSLHVRGNLKNPKMVYLTTASFNDAEQLRLSIMDYSFQVVVKIVR